MKKSNAEKNWTFERTDTYLTTGKTDLFWIREGDYLIAEVDLHTYGQDDGIAATPETVSSARADLMLLTSAPDLCVVLERIRAEGVTLPHNISVAMNAALAKAGF